MTILMTMLQPKPQLQQAPGHGSMRHMQRSSQTQMAAAAMASQWLLDRRLMQIQRRQQRASRGPLRIQHGPRLQVCIGARLHF